LGSVIGLPLNADAIEPGADQALGGSAGCSSGGCDAPESGIEDFSTRFNHWMIGRYYELAEIVCQGFF
jgi:hypothetical protein